MSDVPLTTREMLVEFLKTWGEMVDKGSCSGLSCVEVLTLEIFADYCDKRRLDE